MYVFMYTLYMFVYICVSLLCYLSLISSYSFFTFYQFVSTRILVSFFLKWCQVIKKTNKKCIKCLKLYDNRQKKVECKECENILHLKCIDLTNNQHRDCQKGKSSFHCKYCTEYRCLKCNKHVYDRHKSVCCDKCDRWIQIGCSKITEQKM